MQGQELSDYIKRAENSEDKSATVLVLLQDLSAGNVKHADIFAHYRALYMPKLTRLTAEFGEGRLFKSQRQPWELWLSGSGWEEDYHKSLEYRATRDMVGKGWTDIDTFIGRMVTPSGGARKAMAEKMGQDTAERVWKYWQNSNGWSW